jgi:regulator of sigma E protease
MTTFLAFIVLLGVLIFVHELGHFLVAKAFGVHVEKFSLGFGPKMVGKKIGDTLYQIAIIPLGGYVKMLGENPDEVDEVPESEKARSFHHKPVGVRFLIVLAGVGFNFLFAYVVFTALLAGHGIEHLKPIVGRMAPDSPAAAAGLAPGDEIVAINGRAVKYFDQIQEKAQESRGQTLELTVARGQRTFNVEAAPVKTEGSDLLRNEVEYYSLGIDPYLSPVVGRTLPGTPADRAGLKAGDRITAINDQPVTTWYDVRRLVQKHGADPTRFTVLRDGQEKTLTVTPELIQDTDIYNEEYKEYRIGITNQDETVTEDVGVVRAIGLGAVRTWTQSKLIVGFVIKLIKGEFSARKTVGGPIQIAVMAGEQAKQGIVGLAVLTAVLSINLAILNLLPIPVLDGGHLFFFLLEMVFRRPISLNVREKAQQIGLVFLILLMTFVFLNDIHRLYVNWQTGSGPVAEEHEDPGR